MNTLLRPFAGLSAITLLAGMLGSASGAVTLAVSPQSISNTYSGSITLQVTGLTNGETVTLQKYLDANANGAVDSPDMLVGQFELTDGQPGMVIAGVTNINVPGDTDGSANGQIQSVLELNNGDFAQRIVGKYLFVLSSPSGRFSAKTASFTVTNLLYAQKITGTVTSSGGNVPNAVVILFGPPRPGDHGPGNPLAAAVADNSGTFTLPMPPGTYVPLPFRSNYVANFAVSPQLVLSNNATITTNITLIAATESISGRFVDQNTGAGIPGIFAGNGSQNGYIGTTFSDTNGNFTEGVLPDYWNLDGGPSSLIAHGYVGYDSGTNIDATLGSVSGLTLGFKKASALFYGTVKDNLGNPMPGINISADDGGTYRSDGYSDQNGNYVVASVNEGMAWWVQISSDGAPTNYIFTSGQSIVPTAQVNFTGMLATNHITGTVQFNGTNVVGVGISVSATIGVNNYQGYVDTDSSGSYSLNVPNGLWLVSVNCGGGNNDSLDSLLGNGNYQCPNDQNVGITNADATANFVVQGCSGVQILTTNLPPAQVGVYYDTFLQASSCSSSFSWSFISGSAPPGLNANLSTGEIYGTPGAAGTYNFTVQVTDGSGHSAQQAVSLYVAPAFQITTTSLPDGTNGVFYSQTLQASGGSTPYTWSLNGNSPFGLTLSTNGILSGTPNYSGTNTFTVFVSDSNNVTIFTNLTLVIDPAPMSLGIQTMFLPNGTNGAFYSQTLQAYGGTPPYTWSIPGYSQNPPPNLSLSSGGVLSGMLVTNGGPFYFDVEVTDSALNTAYQTLSLYVVNPPAPPLVITNLSLPGGTVGVAYSAQLGATGGQPPYNWSLAAGSAGPPPGLSLNSLGLISGTPSTNKVSSFKVQVTDSSFSTTNKVFSITISPPPSLSSPVEVTNGVFEMNVSAGAGQTYTVQMARELSATNWTTLLVTNTSSGSFLFIDRSATNLERYYRVLVGP